MPVLKVPAGEEGGPGGRPNLLKEEEKEEVEEEKKERIEMMRRIWKGRGGMMRICRIAWWWRWE